MFEYLNGNVVSKKADRVIIDIGGIGYRLFISLNTYNSINKEQMKMFVYNYIREDQFTLYGFSTEVEREYFQILVNASGVGPKLAIAILSTYSTELIRSIIKNEEVKMLIKVPGLGLKKSKKLILDIKDKINILKGEDSPIIKNDFEEDLFLALKSLGFSDKEINKNIEKNKERNFGSIEEAIKEILKNINN